MVFVVIIVIIENNIFMNLLCICCVLLSTLALAVLLFVLPLLGNMNIFIKICYNVFYFQAGVFKQADKTTLERRPIKRAARRTVKGDSSVRYFKNH